jgi:hypothetical protein
MGHIVISVYKPLDGKTEQLMEVVREHVPILRSQGYATDQTPIFMRSSDGTILEVFEWVSLDAINAAHENPVIHAMWGRFEAACTYVTLANLSECQDLFATFERVE